jgi:hypothetical protein
MFRALHERADRQGRRRFTAACTDESVADAFGGSFVDP